MKKIVLVLGIVSTLILSGCATKGTTDQSTASPTTAPAHHHDYKGEVK